MSSEDIPKGRCGFVLEPGDVPDGEADDYEAGSDEWYEVSDAVCCWRPVWEGRNSDRCIWHADTEDKPADALIKARADGPEWLDGAYVPAVELADAIDFDDCSLQAATFDRTNLRGASFVKVNGRYIEFVDSDLDDAQFRDANLGHALFSHCFLRNAEFRDTDLGRARFDHSELSGVRFRDVYLGQAEFPGVDLTDARFIDTDLREAQFPDAILHRTSFSNANFYRTRFPHADLREAQLPYVDLQDAEFLDADLTDTVLPRSSLQRAEFTDTNVEDAKVPAYDFRDASPSLDEPVQPGESVLPPDLLVDATAILASDGLPDEGKIDTLPRDDDILDRLTEGRVVGTRKAVDSLLTMVFAVVGGSVAFADSLGIGIGAFDQYWFQLSIVLTSALLILGLSVLRIRWELEELLEVTDVFSD